MTSSNGNIVRVIPSEGNPTVTGDFPHKGQLWCIFFYLRWVNSRDAGDLRRHRANFDVIVIITRIGVGRFLWRHLVSLGYDELKLVNGFQIQEILRNISDIATIGYIEPFPRNKEIRVIEEKRIYDH